MAEVSIFYIGCNAVSKPHSERDPWPPVDMVTMKPCVCNGFNNLKADSKIPYESLAATGLSEAEVRSVMREVSDELASRSRCCWKWGFLGPIMLIIWWLDVILQQCGCGITMCLCQWPAMNAVTRILASLSDTLRKKGCELSLVQSSMGVRGANFQNVYFDVWLIQVACKISPA